MPCDLAIPLSAGQTLPIIGTDALETIPIQSKERDSGVNLSGPKLRSEGLEGVVFVRLCFGNLFSWVCSHYHPRRHFYQIKSQNKFSGHVTHCTTRNKCLKSFSGHAVSFYSTDSGQNKLHEIQKSGNNFWVMQRTT